MKLSRVASYFHKAVCRDAYDPFAFTFKGQLALFDDSKREGVSVERRILEVAPDIAVPARNAIFFDGQYWIVGQGQTDNWNGAIIRRKYNIQTAEGLANVQSFYQLLTGGGTTMYADRVWQKGAKEVETSSNVFNVYEIYVGLNETSLKEKSLVSLAGRFYLARAVHTTPSGFLAATADELPEPVLEVIQYASNQYDPISDEMVSTVTPVKVIRIRWQAEFNYLTQASTKYQHGDMHGVVAKESANPKAGDILPMADAAWRVVSVTSEGQTWGLHLRRD